MAIDNHFSVIRAKALNTYADLERMLAILFNKLLGADDEIKSYIVFSAIINYRSRRELLTRLMKQTYGDKYKAFFKTLMAHLAAVESDRNKIVHWIALTSHTGGKTFDPKTDINLHEHPNMYGDRTMSQKDIENFTERADFIRLLAFYFGVYLKYGNDMDEGGSWRNIFQQRVEYPPPTDHPLSQMRTKPQGWPPPSQA
jgi:hypothetical protein